MIFEKSDVAVIDGQKYMCIISDNEVAVLGLMMPNDDGGHSVKYEDCAIYSNQLSMKDGIVGLERVEDIHSIEKTEFVPDAEYGLMESVN